MENWKKYMRLHTIHKTTKNSNRICKCTSYFSSIDICSTLMFLKWILFPLLFFQKRNISCYKNQKFKWLKYSHSCTHTQTNQAIYAFAIYKKIYINILFSLLIQFFMEFFSRPFFKSILDKDKKNSILWGDFFLYG